MREKMEMHHLFSSFLQKKCKLVQHIRFKWRLVQFFMHSQKCDHYYCVKNHFSSSECTLLSTHTNTNTNKQKKPLKKEEERDSHQITTEQKTSHILINRSRLQLDSIFMVMADKSKCVCVWAVSTPILDVRFSRCNFSVWESETNLHSSLISFEF